MAASRVLICSAAILFFLAASAFLAPEIAAEDAVDSSSVLTLDASNFSDTVAKHPFIVVEFYAPWCGHCKKLAPEYEKAASVLSKHDPPVILAKVDANEEINKEIASNYDVKGYPTLKILRNQGNDVQDYKGPREAEGIVEYLKKQVGPASAEIKSPEDAGNLIDEKKIFIVGVFPDFSGEEFENFTVVSEKLRSDYDFGHTLDVKLLPRGDPSIKGPVVRLLKPFDELFVDFQDFHVDALENFIQSASTPVVTVFNKDPNNHPFVIKFFNSPNAKANLADSFLADLDDLSDNEEANLFDDEVAEDRDMEEDGDSDIPDLESLNYDDLDSVSKLQKSQRYIDIMQKVEDALQKGSDISGHGSVLEDNPEYQLIVDCNALSVDIENEIIIIHNFIRDKYRLKFPELESLVHHPIDYARVVKKIGNEMDLTLVNLEGLLPSAIIMVISVTASTTSGKPLPEDSLAKTIDACDRALALDTGKKKVLDFVESRMGYIAPNLSAIVGSAVAAKLVGIAGGLSALAKMPACNVMLLGAKRKNLAGFSTATSQFRVGYLEQSEIFQSTPPSLRNRACRLLAAKSTLAARVDSISGDPTGKTGRSLLQEIRKKIEKWQEPPPAKLPKPLPVPDSEPKKKRGGRRLRKMKERYAVTDMRKMANRMRFGVPEESSLGDGLGEGYGMLGQAGSGKLRVAAAQSKLGAKVTKKFKERQFGSSGATSGLTSSLAFTPVQGIELTNPQAHGNVPGSGTRSTYFSETGTFSKIKRT